MYTAPTFLPIADITFITEYFCKEGCGTHVKHNIVKLSSMLMFACQHIFYLISFLYIFYVAKKKTKLMQKYKSETASIYIYGFKVCKSVHHHTIQINHQPNAIIFQFIILRFIYSSTCFGRSPAHHQELNDCSSSLWFYLRIVVIAVLCLWSGR